MRAPGEGYGLALALGIARYFAHTAEMSDLFGEEEEAAIVQAVLERRS